MTQKKETEIFLRENFWEEIKKSKKKFAHVIMIGTKPDIIKQAPIYNELKSRGELVVLVHTGQHYDYNLSIGVLEEFNMVVDLNLNIFGVPHKKFSLVIERLGDFLVELNDKYGKLPIPYVHGDTLVAHPSAKTAFLNRFAVVHVEAGIRTFTPSKKFYQKLFKDYNEGKFNWKKYYKSIQNEDIYEQGSIEPFPEQYDTRGVAPCTGLHCAPVELYKKTLLREGFPKEIIKVVGNTIADAVFDAKKKTDLINKGFEMYPNMKGKPFIFITIHRRENTEKKERFLVIYNAIKKLIMDGHYVCFIGLPGSEQAIDNYGLRKDIESLQKKYSENFSYGPPIAHHSTTIGFISKAGVVMTDSGGFQEETNIIGVPCVTVRFGSDRSETFLAGTNIIAPPINSNLMAEIVVGAIGNKKMKSKKHLYGKNISKKIVDEVMKKLEKHGKLFRLDDERLDLEQYFDWKIN